MADANMRDPLSLDTLWLYTLAPSLFSRIIPCFSLCSQSDLLQPLWALLTLVAPSVQVEKTWKGHQR